MNENVFDLAQADTILKKVSVREYAGPCPRCGGTDRFHVQPGRKDGNGEWFCRVCRPVEQKGWSDGIEYLRQMRGMSFTEAKNYLSGEVDSLLEQVEQYQTQALLPKNEQLQDKYQVYIRRAQALLWLAEGKPCLDYLHSRGLTDKTIEEMHLGCIDSETLRREKLARIEVDTQFILIPWYADNILWRVQLRDIASKQYRNFPKSGEGLYLGDCLRRKYPTFLVESEIDALTIAQEAGDICNVVATGSTDRGRTAKWEGRLARVPSVLVAFDRDQEGDRAAKYWLKIFNGVTTIKRWKPLVKDVNDMHMQGYNVRTWVTAALEYLNPSPVISEPEAPSLCSLCSSEVYMFVEDGSEFGEPLCEVHYQALQQQQPEQPAEPLTPKEQFQAIAEQLASAWPGPGVREVVEVLPAGTLTFEKHLRAIEEQQRAYDSDRWQARRKTKVR